MQSVPAVVIIELMWVIGECLLGLKGLKGAKAVWSTRAAFRARHWPSAVNCMPRGLCCPI